jgi:hypothetical protein
MNAAVLSIETKNAQRFQPSIVSREPPPALAVTSLDFFPVETMPSAFVTVHLERPGVLHRLRYYVGAALAGSVLFGLAFGWVGQRELVQAVGALVGVVWYLRVRRHFTD